jgi:CheY-like chemotaxis protein
VVLEAVSTTAKTMLVVSASAEVRAALHRVGRQLGLEVTFVDGAVDALLVVVDQLVDVLMLDHRPADAPDDLEGAIDAIEALNERAAIIVVVDSPDPREVEEADRAGAEAVVTVPFDAHEVSAAIERTFGPVPVSPSRPRHELN